MPVQQAAAGTLPPSSLFARETPPAPVTPPTQFISSGPATQGIPSLNLGVALGDSAGAPGLASPLPRGRNIAALRAPRGTNFIRLAIAALFLLGFLGLAGFFLKDTIMGLVGVDDPGSDLPVAPVLPQPNAPGSIEAPHSLGVVPPAPEAGAVTPPSNSGNQGMMVTAEPHVPVIQGTGLGSAPVQPLESVPPRAQPATDAEIQAMTGTGGQTTAATASTAAPATPAAPENKLLEVASKPDGMEPRPQNVATAPGSFDRPDSAAAPTTDEGIPPKAMPALDALKAFLNASTVSERSKLTLGADVMRPLMERYYSKMSDGPVSVDHISFSNFDDKPDLGTGAHCIFRLESKIWEYPVPVMMEKQADGWKVDWLTFIELKDRKLEEFFKGYHEGRFMFHVGIFRQHYFDDAVPNRDQKDCFSVGLERPNPFRAPVFLSKESPLAQQLRERLPWEVHVWAIVELEWKKLGSQQWVELVSMPQMHWYSVPAQPKAKPVSAPEQPSSLPAEPVPPPLGNAAAGSPPKAAPVTEEKFPPGIRRSPATGGR
jgi:hypothetical protein